MTTAASHRKKPDWIIPVGPMVDSPKLLPPSPAELHSLFYATV